MSINFSTNSQELNASKNKLFSGQDATNWVLYGYSQGNDLKLTGSGDGGLEELKDEFEGSKVQYALAKVIEPNSNLPKIILISWCPDGVPVARKGLFNVHVNEASHYFKGYHLHIQARHDEDIDPALIMEKVKQASGAKYSIQQGVANPSLSKPADQPKQFVPPPSVASSSSFTPPSKTNSYSPLVKPKPAASVSSGVTAYNSYTPPVNKPNMVKSGVTASNSYHPAINPSKPISSSTSSYVPQSLSDRSLAFNQPPSSVSSSSYQPIKLNPKPLYGEGVATAAYTPPSDSVSPNTSSYVSPVSPTNFKDTQSLVSKPTLERKNSYVPSVTPLSFNGAAARESVASRPPERRPSYVPPAAPISFNGGPAPATSPNRDSTSKSVFGRKSSYVPPVTPVSFNGAPTASVKLPSSATLRSSTSSASNKVSEEQDEQNSVRAKMEQMKIRDEQEAQRLEQQRVEQQRLEQQRAEQQRLEQQRAEQQRLEQQRAEQQRLEQQKVEQQRLAQQTVEEQMHEVVASQSEISSSTLNARVLYDYEPAEANEIRLIEGDIITQVIQIDEGWWEGANPEGQRGFFPSNYVELVSISPDTDVRNVPNQPQTHLEASHMVAIALYDYEAAEENELTFATDEVITEIEFVSDDWWSGSCRGIIGLFPSNYVTLTAE